MKKKLELGDRVSIRGYCDQGYNCDGLQGSISIFFNNQTAEILFEIGDRRTVCISQLVRLVKKPPRKRVWIYPPWLAGSVDDLDLIATKTENKYWTEFVEVRKKK